MKGGSTGVLVGCGALFGSTFVLIRFAVPSFGPVAVTAVRALLGGALLLAVAWRRHDLPRLGDWRGFAVLGLLSAALPFSLLALASVTLNAGTVSVLNTSSVPIALVIEAVRRRHAPGARQIAGVLLATAGVVVVMSTKNLSLDGPGAFAGVVAAVAGAGIFAYGGFYAADRFAKTGPVALAAGQQIAAFALLAPAVLVLPPAGPFPPLVLGAAVLVGVLGSGVAYLLFYWLIDREGPARAANVNLLVPGFGVGWGAVLLGEDVTRVAFAGMAVTLAGLVLVLRRPEG
ncbi:threonine/homoserine efflux transporter RhtA [Actinocorallia herbida]|uniref:Threonine/homoserine efflux transporter RhtA n=1 Tax=Actinocorallia herbida TaxID=58109 RepID=A0A3N1D0Z4_9ACTN|nr:DMT family transporter [Actinocorallia herbida]ROO87176.1 threonine/homoserine efflux transporter RhtA [Actinocorallia herbida]